jgi:mono/diheme cytochrome c family protein
MKSVCLVALAVLLGFGGSFAFGRQAAKSHERANIAAGRELFHQNCSVCHGEDAKGNGSMYDPESAEESRRIPPADLTTLSARNGGQFPAQHVRDSVYSKQVLPAHGTPDMPAWGHAFDILKSNPKRLEESLRNLTAYIESIQEPAK